MIDFPKLHAEFPRERVSWRGQVVSKDGTKALAFAYIDARDVQDRLDAVCGPENWQNRFQFAGNKTICEIGVKVGEEWIWKADGAGDTDFEAEKGALSDAFKRAAVKWGVGRFLYDLPAVWVPCESYQKDGKFIFKRFTDDPWKYLPAARGSTAPGQPGAGSRGADGPASTADELITEICTFDNVQRLQEWAEGIRAKVEALGKAEADRVRRAYKERLHLIGDDA